MILKKITYSEYAGESRSWELKELDLFNINLLVGKNSTGKSRSALVVHGITQIFSGERKKGFDSGTYSVKLEHEGKEYHYTLESRGGTVIQESLSIDGVLKLSRNSDGRGEIFYEEEQKFIKFKLIPESIAISNNQDELQHPFLVPLENWARSSEFYQFGSDFSRGNVLTQDQAMARMKENQDQDSPQKTIIEVYLNAYKKFGEPFDVAIISDMLELGYDIKDVGCTNMEINIPGVDTTLFGLYTVETDLDFKIFQGSMSQGMFRALALSISLNYYAFMKQDGIIIIDDIGEGLDYIRAKAVIKLVIKKIQESGAQVIMTSNDQFTMNNVPLKYWSVLKRKGNVVTAYNSRNSRDKFESFEYMGLNNFDLFASDIIN